MDKKFIDWITENEICLPGGCDPRETLIYKAYLLGKQSKRKPKNDPHPAYSFCVELWLKEVHPNWRFNGSEGKALNELIAQMEKYFMVQHDRSPMAQETFNFFKHFCLKLPNFYKTKNLKILNQNFDGIIEEIKTQNGKKRTIQRPAEHLSDFAR